MTSECSSDSGMTAMDEDRHTPSYAFRPILDAPADQTSHLGSILPRRQRFNSGMELASPTTLRPTPKLHSCYRNSQDVWSSTGSRHSSRPGSSSAASSRPSSQCNNSNSLFLYNRSNNGSLTDVSVARNFQQLSVSTRRAAFKTQKWSHSFDQGCILSSSSAQTSPGRRRQASLQQKSLDLDSGYLGSSAGDLKSSCAVSYSWTNEQQQSVCSPVILQEAREELRELRLELEEEEEAAAARASAKGVAPVDIEDPLSRSASLPSFPESFHVSTTGLRRHMREKVLPVLESAGDLSVDAAVGVAEEQLDEEIKMIVALGQQQQQPEEEEVVDEDVLSFLNRHCPLTNTSVNEEEVLLLLLRKPEPTKPCNDGGQKPSSFGASFDLPSLSSSYFSSTAAGLLLETRGRLVRSKTMPDSAEAAESVLEQLLRPDPEVKKEDSKDDFPKEEEGDEGDDSSSDVITSDPNLINPQNRQGYGRNVPDQIVIQKEKPKTSEKSSVDDRSISEQTEQAILQFGVLVAVSLLVGILFFVNVGIELLLDKIVQKLSDMFGRAKTLDIEEQDPASLVGTFKRYK